MDYEKLYNETINKLRKLHNDWNSTQNRAAKEIELVLPELRESKDERIREEIVDYLRKFIPHHDCDLVAKSKEWIAWLEKQGEQRFVDKVEQKPYPETLDKAIELYYYSYGNGKGGFDYLSLEKFKDIVKTFVDDYGMQKCTWSEEDERNLEGIIGEIEETKNDAPDYDLATYDRLLSWLKSIKDRIQPQPKQEWGEEDKYMLKVVGNLTLAGYKEYPHPDIPSLEIIRDWLKSLTPNHWKPTEEQLKALRNLLSGSFSMDNSKTYQSIESLHNDLKNL